ncbi:radical SAM family heme chaperone HemW [uncultured Anaerococcus sp.]|uniref:radical SAM family heme chaperone HemW n=1 Tax=uncultured Anaerococcus sp. TaxID=293428 RepID=UPI0028898EFD|nr:radical SAM family heme chaperone HemW [uncultured Anaerococcus sp.]
MNKVGAYIHIPFCEKKCYYCDFAAFPNLEKWIEPYVENLIKEIRLYRERMDVVIDSIYIGGGTPSYINPSLIEKIVSELFNFKSDIEEFTIEANPKSLDMEKLKIYKDLGINRISLGVQSFDDKVLKNIGRNHTRDVAIRDIEMIREAGFENLSFDLMLNLPGQDFESVKRDLEMVKILKPNHISWYSLILDKGSRFYALEKDGKLDLMDSDIEVEIFSYLIEELGKIGLNRYEISNFAKKGFESFHNKKYWNEEGYLGLGLAAAGFLSNLRYNNVKNLAIYDRLLKENKLPVINKDFVSKEENEKEYIIFKLREVEGINLAEFKQRYGVDFLEKYKKEIEKFLADDFFIIDKDIKFTTKGMSLSNEFFVEII